MISQSQIEFEKRLHELGVSYRLHDRDFYSITKQSGSENHIKVQLISSLPVNKLVHGSKNGNDVQAIGLFKFKFSSKELEPDIFVFTCQNTVANQPEFLIIPTQEFLRRHVRMKSQRACNKRLEVVLWFMEDGFVYDATNISIEAEWYFLSKGFNGRMADGTDLDYTPFLNSWVRLML